jgi:hypothetical protein
LREVSLKFAKRVSLISPEALYATKRAVNRVADAAGFRTKTCTRADVHRASREPLQSTLLRRSAFAS